MPKKKARIRKKKPGKTRKKTRLKKPRIGTGSTGPRLK